MSSFLLTVYLIWSMVTRLPTLVYISGAWRRWVPCFAEGGESMPATERLPSYPSPTGWRSLSGKVTHKVAHNDASDSERKLKAEGDHDQEKASLVVGSTARSGLCMVQPRCLFPSVNGGFGACCNTPQGSKYFNGANLIPCAGYIQY